MNRYKIACLFLAFSLLAALVWLVVLTNSKTEVTNNEQAVIENILSRKSVRIYTDRKVPREKLDTLVRLGMSAPTGMDVRPWQFLIADSDEALQKLATAMPRAKQFETCKAAIVVMGDTAVLDRRGNPSTNWPFDCSAATENILLGAEAMGLGACWVAVYPYEDRLPFVKEQLGLPANVIPLCVVTIGYPDGKNQPKDKYNPDIIHYNGW